MEPDLKTISEKRDAARLKTIGEIREMNRTTVLHINQLHKMTGIGYQRLRSFLTLNKSVTLTDAELVNLHNALS